MNNELRKYLSTSQDDFQQQTFLGCTVRDFNANGGYGDSVSTLHVQLVPDEYSKSDETLLGFGDDVYHNGVKDIFNPPLPGSPVFFKFGPTFSTIEQAWMPEFDFIYGTNFSQQNTGHFVFGGIIQTYGESASTNGDPLYSVTVNDPREILGNVTLILNNYANSVFNIPNIMNIYGFLEYNPSEKLKKQLKNYYGPGSPYLFEKIYSNEGAVSFSNGLQNVPLATDMYATKDFLQTVTPNFIPRRFLSLGDFPHVFPFTGTSFARHREAGMPVYRIVQALFSLMGVYGPLPEEYRLKDFGGLINFRGFNYIVDFSGIPFHLIPPSYNINFDQMTLLEFLQEVCEVISYDLSISLLPVIEHPASYAAFLHNQKNPQNPISGIIRVDGINRSHTPNYGAITNFIKTQKEMGINVTSTDIGVELSNITTNKLIVGAQQVDMHIFNVATNNYFFTESLGHALRKPVIPFFGFLGNDCVSVPLGQGPYKQILLDSSALNANGVGSYYVATEIELRTALISYEEWKAFLLSYNDIYLEGIDTGEEIPYAASYKGEFPDGIMSEEEQKIERNKKYVVCVPRCLFVSDKNYFDEDGNPASPCSPPYGWPLYYKRAEMIGIPDSSFARYITGKNSAIQNFKRIENLIKNGTALSYVDVVALQQELSRQLWDSSDYNKFDDASKKIIENIQELFDSITNPNKTDLTQEEREKAEVILRKNIGDIIGLIQQLPSNYSFSISDSRKAKRLENNSRKIYEFLKSAAQNIGVKYLVKVPKIPNIMFHPTDQFVQTTGLVTSLDFGESFFGEILKYEYYIYNFKGERSLHLKPMIVTPNQFPIRDILGNIKNIEMDQNLKKIRLDLILEYSNLIRNYSFNYRKNSGFYLPFDGISFLYNTVDTINIDTGTESRIQKLLNNDIFKDGALKASYDGINDLHYFNYKPEPQGGFFDKSLYSNIFKIAFDKNIQLFSKYYLFRNMFLPIDISFLLEENRILPYAVFYDSKNVDFSSLPTDSYSQQNRLGEGVGTDFGTDLTLDYDNSTKDVVVFEKNPKPTTDAFVKCQIDDKFYMTPKFRLLKKFPVSGGEVKSGGYITKIVTRDEEGRKKLKLKFIPTIFPLADLRLKDKWSTCTTFFGDSRKSFKPDSAILPEVDVSEDNIGFSFDFLNSLSPSKYPMNHIIDYQRFQDDLRKTDIISTNEIEKDTDHVYILVTLPGFIGETEESKYNQWIEYNQDAISKMFLQDIVPKEIPGMHTPAPKEYIQTKSQPTEFQEALTITNGDPEAAVKMVDDIKGKGGGISNKENVNQAAFNATKQRRIISFYQPKYPNLFVLPLMSTERCYGPWISSNLNLEANLLKFNPGKIDFIKDENLAPWNYAGYDLMNEAGNTLAQFGNGLLPYEEKGSISFVGLPAGNSLMRPLAEGGPLVTNIDVRIGTDGVTTTYNMSTYSPRFGNLQKQKEERISKLSRDRQKFADSRNKNIRMGMMKSRSNEYMDFTAINTVSSISADIRNRFENPTIIPTVNLDENTGDITSNSNTTASQPSEPSLRNPNTPNAQNNNGMAQRGGHGSDLPPIKREV